MSPDRTAFIHAWILEHAEEMQRRLPAHENHPKGRIAVAHCYDVLKRVFGVPVKHARNCRFQDAVEILEFCLEHAEEKSVARLLYPIYEKEPEDKPAGTLEEFF